MDKDKYKKLVNKHTPQKPVLVNAIMTFLVGGLMGLGSEILLELYVYYLDLPRKESGVLVILTLITISSILTAFGVFDILVTKLKSALIIPITGFTHSITSAAMDYRSEGLILGIGANILKLAGSVILYGVVAVYIFGIIRVLIIGG